MRAFGGRRAAGIRYAAAGENARAPAALAVLTLGGFCVITGRNILRLSRSKQGRQPHRSANAHGQSDEGLQVGIRHGAVDRRAADEEEHDSVPHC